MRPASLSGQQESRQCLPSLVLSAASWSPDLSRSERVGLNCTFVSGPRHTINSWSKFFDVWEKPNLLYRLAIPISLAPRRLVFLISGAGLLCSTGGSRRRLRVHSCKVGLGLEDFTQKRDGRESHSVAGFRGSGRTYLGLVVAKSPRRF